MITICNNDYYDKHSQSICTQVLHKNVWARFYHVACDSLNSKHIFVNEMLKLLFEIETKPQYYKQTHIISII